MSLKRLILAITLAVFAILYIRHILPIIFSQGNLQILYTTPLLIAPIYLVIDLSRKVLTKFLSVLVSSFITIYVYLAYITPQLQVSPNLFLIISILSVSLALASLANRDSIIATISSYYLSIIVSLTPPIYRSSNSITDYLFSLIIGAVLGTALLIVNYVILGVARISSMPKPYKPSTISAFISFSTSLTILEAINQDLNIPVSIPSLSVIPILLPAYILAVVEGILSTAILRISLIGIKVEPKKTSQPPTIKVERKGNPILGEVIELIIEYYEPSQRNTKISLEIVSPSKKVKKARLKRIDKNKFSTKYKLEEIGEYRIIIKGKGGLTYGETKLTVTDKLPKITDLDPKIWVGKELYGYKVTEVIGSGGSGYVLKGNKENKQVAIKIMKVTNQFSIDDIAKEISNVSSLTLKEDSENYLVGVYEIYFNRNNLKKAIADSDVTKYIESPPVIIMEYMEGGTAYDLMKNDQFFYSKFWEDIVCNIMKSTAYGLSILHREGYVHLDVKPQNIFFNVRLPQSPMELLERLKSNRVKIKLGDFGSATKEGEKYYFATPYYAPGEQIIEAIKISKRLPSTGARKYMDVYSLGATAFTLLTRSYLNSQTLIKVFDSSFSDGNIEIVEKAWKEFSVDLERIRQYKLYPLISSMVKKEPLNRPTIEQIIQEFQKIC